jgi:hypothetical protein
MYRLRYPSRAALLRTVLFAVGLGAATVAAAQEGRITVEHEGLRLSAAPRAPDQIGAFYLGRGFPKVAVEELAAACFITVGIRNGRSDVVWLEPARWQFVAEDGEPIQRLGRAYWTARWEALGVPDRNRATFGWTQLPEVRDLRPGEPVGGNIALRPVDGPFAIEARFETGEDRRGPELVVHVPGLRCARGSDGGGAP